MCNKVFGVAKNQKYDGYQTSFSSNVCKFFDKKSSGNWVKSEIMTNQ